MNFFRFLILAAVVGATAPAFAHEYYLEPDKYTADVGEEFGVAHKNGMKFKGNAYPWIGQWNIRSEAWQNGAGVKVFGKDGDRPALKLASQKPGLVAIIHQSNLSDLTFNDWDKFKSYLADEGLEKIADQHDERGLPRDKIKEVYSRFAKTLINVGDGKDLETPTGLQIEMVALVNPSTLERGDKLPVQVLWQGKPLAGATVKVFAGVDTEVASRTVTDAEGKAMIPDSGAGAYLLNAVHMVPALSDGAKEMKADWESFWASLTLSRG